MREYLELWQSSSERALVDLEGDRVTVGKAHTCDVAIPWDPAVSRLHAALERYGEGAWAMKDLGSRNGTFVNGERVTQERVLRPGDEVRVGETRLVFRTERRFEDPTTAATEGPPALTARQRDVLVELCRPMLRGEVFREPATAREIADVLYVSEDAVKQHLRNLYQKFGIHEGERRRRVTLANEAIRRGAVGPADLSS